MAYRFEELPGAPSGAGLEKNVWHRLSLNPTSLGPVLDIMGYVTWVEPPDLNIQVAGYAALFWTDNSRFGGTPIIGASRPILTRFMDGAQGFHQFCDPMVDVYRDASGYLPSGAGIMYYIKPYMPDMQWRFFGAVP